MSNIKIKVTHDNLGNYTITARAGRFIMRRDYADNADAAEMKADVMEQELLDNGFTVKVEIAA